MSDLTDLHDARSVTLDHVPGGTGTAKPATLAQRLPAICDETPFTICSALAIIR